MDAKKFLLASLAGAVTLFALGFILYGVLLRDFMTANSLPGFMKEQPDFAPLILGELLFGMFLTLILSRWSGIGSFVDGAKAGAMLGLLFALGLNLVFYATTNMMQAVVIPTDAAVNAVRMGLAGGVIAVVLGRRG
jgi:hypothetical protein